ncbi:hypothetical protein BXZ70DRAFT_916661 [Cristinia sonorae]|uniref:DNA-directed RNA polymerase III subunit RPC3 n=1 Tax=Cristinia sonorae TaxID=1940300 RepID=A0A8K0XUL6_9AGAR|nr:hypothetical protein BXZ70DRAFT_916661 [Cristinia sonorae]
MADINSARLCEQIIRNDFGPLTATVAATVLSRGRLPLPTIIRYSGLKPRTVRAAILVLVQHNILWHAQSEEGDMLEVNVEECLYRLRYGRYVWQAGQLYGDAGAEIVQLILDHGKLRPPDIMSRLATQASVKDPSVFAQAMHKLVECSYLKPSTVLSHVSPLDKRIKYEAEEKAKISGFPTAKQLREAKEIAEGRLKREEEEAEKVGMKRKAKDLGKKPSKRKAVEEDVVDDDVYFRVNCEKFNIHMRNKIIEDAAKERFNDFAGLVLRAALKATETKQLHVADMRSDPTSLADISLHLGEDTTLEDGFVHTSKKASHMTMLKDYVGILASADNPTPSGQASSFVSFSGSKVQVEFAIIRHRLKRRVIEAVVRERYGEDAVRIVRLLLDTGKMEEKLISKVGMMAPKDVRPLLTALSAESLISVTEIAKSADRNPARMFFLWYVDLQKACSIQLGHLYKTLYNIVARRQAEEEEAGVKAVLEKRQRSDVSQDEERYLTRNEREVLAAWEKKREKLTVLEMRIEETVFILRDFGSILANDEE